MVKNLSQLLTTYWEQKRILTKTGKFLGKYFRKGRGLTQGYPTSPIIFKVDAVVREVLDVVCVPQ